MNKLITVIILILITNISVWTQIVWSTGMNLAVKTYGNYHPRIVVDGSGNPMVIWGRASDESVFFARWNNGSFTTPVKLNPAGFTIATQSWMGPDIASKGDTLYIIMKRTPETENTNRIFIISSTDGGITFSSPKEIGFISDSLSRFPTLTVDSKGNPIAAFMKFNQTFGEARWVVLSSADMGNTFSSDIKASGQEGGTVCDCCPGAITGSGNTVVMLYRTNINNIRDSWIGLSNDNAVTFPKGFNVDNNNWKINSCPATGPDGAIIGDTLYSVFMSGASGKSNTYLSRFSLVNSKVASVNLLSEPIPGFITQNYPRIDAYGRALAIVWKHAVDGNDQLRLLFTNDVTGGFLTKNGEIVDMDNITNADVALSNGKIFVVWQDDNSGTVKFRSGNYSPVNSVAIDMKDDLYISPNPASDFIEINVGMNVGSAGEIGIYDVFGRKIHLTPTLSEGEGVRLDVSKLVPGLYFVRIGTEVHKFIKL